MQTTLVPLVAEQWETEDSGSEESGGSEATPERPSVAGKACQSWLGIYEQLSALSRWKVRKLHYLTCRHPGFQRPGWHFLGFTMIPSLVVQKGQRA